MDWVKFLVSAVIGLVSYCISMKFNVLHGCYFLVLLANMHNLFYQVTVISSLSMPKADIRVIFAILSAVIGYCVKTYFS